MRESDIFKQIWEERPHHSQISGKHLGYLPKADYFFHILPKGSYPSYRLRKENIILTTLEEHRDWHSKPKSELLKQNKRWQIVFDKYEQLKQQYYRERKYSNLS